MICSPKRTSRTVTEVVQMEERGCWSSQLTTLGSGVWRMSAESTLVSRMIIPRTMELRSHGHAVRECQNRDRPLRTRRKFLYPAPEPGLHHGRLRCAGCRESLPPCCGRCAWRDVAAVL